MLFVGRRRFQPADQCHLVGASSRSFECLGDGLFAVLRDPVMFAARRYQASTG